MIVAVIDNGSLEAAAHRNLRRVATELSMHTGIMVEAVSWKHSDRIPAVALNGMPASTLAPWVRAQVACGERDFLFVPFFISAQGAIGSALRRDLETLSSDLGGISIAFTEGLAASRALAGIAAARVRETLAFTGLSRPAVIVVDHGGPSLASATLRDEIATDVGALLADEIGPLLAASMEGAHGPLLADALVAPDFHHGDVIIVPLFLSPGRHAGPDGDLARIAQAAARSAAGRRCHFTGLVGTHELAGPTLVAALREALQSFPLHPNPLPPTRRDLQPDRFHA